MRTTTLLLLVPMFCLAAAHAGQQVEKVGNLYKWVDENGQVHYSDAPPPEAARQKREVLNEQGLTVEVLEAQKTPEQIAEERRQRELAEQRAREAREQAERDRVLLSTYTSVADIERARDGRLQAVESQIRVVSGTIANLEQRIAELEQRRKFFTDNGKDVPPGLTEDLQKARKQLLDNQQFLMAREEERDQIRQKFAADIERYQELKRRQAEEAAAARGTDPAE